MAADFDFEGMDDNLYFDRDGKSLTMAQWAELSSAKGTDYIRVDRTRITDLANPEQVYSISTIWTGLNLSHSDSLPPLIFETLVRYSDDPTDSKAEVLRYRSKEDAQLGHNAAIAEFSSRCSVPHVEELP